LCLVRNISSGGVMVHVYRPVEIGTKVGIEIRNDDLFTGEVVWARDSNIGVRFDEPIDVPTCWPHPRSLATAGERGGHVWRSIAR
jgi:hypothetical protein